jgi:hypothetical protein
MLMSWRLMSWRPGCRRGPGSGVDQAAEPGGVVVDELDEPGVTSHRVAFADEDGEQVQVGPGGDSVPVRTRRSPPRLRR